MRFHAYVSKMIDGNNVPLYYAYCGAKGTAAKAFFYTPQMFAEHYGRDLACKKCSAAVKKILPAPVGDYTVVGFYDDNNQRAVFHVTASSPDHAEHKARLKGYQESGLNTVRVCAVFPGHIRAIDTGEYAVAVDLPSEKINNKNT